MSFVKKNLLLVVGLLILVIFFIAFISTRQNSQEVRIGFIGSLTGVDPDYGEAMKGGVEIAVEKINSEGGVNGKQLKVIYEDGKCIDSKLSVSAAQKLINIDNVKIIIGGGCSSEISSIVPIVDENKVLVLSSGASSPDITGASDFVFRNAASDSVTGKELARYVLNNSYKKIAVISEPTDYSRGFKNSFIREFSNLNGTVVFDEEIPLNSFDYRSVITKLKSLEIDAIFVNPNTPKIAGLFVKQAGELDLKKQIFLAYHLTPAFLEAAGNFSDGVIAINLPFPNNPLAKEVLSHFEKKYGHQTVYPYNTVAAYDAVNIIYEGIKKNGLNTDKLKDYIASLKAYNGGLGQYGFNSDGDISGLTYRFQKVINGEFILLND